MRVGALTDLFHRLFAQDFSGRFSSKAFARCVVELVADLLDVTIGHRPDVALARKPASSAAVVFA